ncbi:D-cysteine desulfhydrase [Escherichia coli]|uniref:D-cysteine desulfhydrase n=1 Tax=Escherichia coli TaxID=562 RepID=A0A377D556_ECOLX|nr:D-cysteine desulfhydrase [Escherichia coli]
MPESELIGVTVSRSVVDQLPKVVNLQQAIAKELELTASAENFYSGMTILHLATACRTTKAWKQ